MISMRRSGKHVIVLIVVLIVILLFDPFAGNDQMALVAREAKEAPAIEVERVIGKHLENKTATHSQPKATDAIRFHRLHDELVWVECSEEAL